MQTFAENWVPTTILIDVHRERKKGEKNGRRKEGRTNIQRKDKKKERKTEKIKKERKEGRKEEITDTQ